jgi:hypothetical protein
MNAKMPAHLKLALGVADAAALTDLSEPMIRRMIRDGVLAPIPNMNRVLIARVELDRWAASSRPELLELWEASFGRPGQAS